MVSRLSLAGFMAAFMLFTLTAPKADEKVVFPPNHYFACQVGTKTVENGRTVVRLPLKKAPGSFVRIRMSNSRANQLLLTVSEAAMKCGWDGKDTIDEKTRTCSERARVEQTVRANGDRFRYGTQKWAPDAISAWCDQEVIPAKTTCEKRSDVERGLAYSFRGTPTHLTKWVKDAFNAYCR